MEETKSPMISKESKKIINFREFYNFGQYYLKLSHNDKEELLIVCYDIDKLDGIRYETKTHIQQIYNLNSIFKQYANIKDIYELILDLIKDNQISLSLNPENNLLFSFTITDIKRNNHKVDIVLVNNSNDNNSKEYINILTNEIISLRKSNISHDKEIKELKNEIKSIKDLISQNNKKNDLTNNNEKKCFYCGNKNDLKKCICKKYFCDKCISDNRNINCQNNCFVFNNNLNILTSYYQISKFPLPKNFEAKVHFNKVNMIRLGITFEPNIIEETKYDMDSPQYNIYYIGQHLNSSYTYKKDWHSLFKSDRELKGGDDLILRIKDGNIYYLLNGNSISGSFSLDKDIINEKKMFLLIHRRNNKSECQLKYIYELD